MNFIPLLENNSNFTNIMDNSTIDYDIVFDNFIFPVGIMFGVITCFICCCTQVKNKNNQLHQNPYTIITKTININDLDHTMDNPPKYEDGRFNQNQNQNQNQQQYIYNTFVSVKNDTL